HPGQCAVRADHDRGTAGQGLRRGQPEGLDRAGGEDHVGAGQQRGEGVAVGHVTEGRRRVSTEVATTARTASRRSRYTVPTGFAPLTLTVSRSMAIASGPYGAAVSRHTGDTASSTGPVPSATGPPAYGLRSRTSIQPCATYE